MFSSHRLIAIFLIIALVTTIFCVQKARADECQDALDSCYRANFESELICATYGYDHQECIDAIRRSTAACLYAIIVCSN